MKGRFDLWLLLGGFPPEFPKLKSDDKDKDDNAKDPED